MRIKIVASVNVLILMNIPNLTNPMIAEKSRGFTDLLPRYSH